MFWLLDTCSASIASSSIDPLIEPSFPSRSDAARVLSLAFPSERTRCLSGARRVLGCKRRQTALSNRLYWFDTYDDSPGWITRHGHCQCCCFVVLVLTLLALSHGFSLCCALPSGRCFHTRSVYGRKSPFSFSLLTVLLDAVILPNPSSSMIRAL
jgi:hypothetical protein